MRKRRGRPKTIRTQPTRTAATRRTTVRRTVLLHVGDLTASTIGDARLGDLGRIDRVVTLDIFRPYNAGDNQLTHFEVDADLLLPLNHKISVWQDLRHNAG